MTMIKKEDLIKKYVTEIIDHANNRIEERSGNKITALNNYIISGRQPSIVSNSGVSANSNTNRLSINAGQPNDRRTFDIEEAAEDIDSDLLDIIPLTGTFITASALIDIILAYGHRMTKVRRVNFSVRGAGVQETKRVSMKESYRLNAAAFRGALESAPNVLDPFQPGNFANETSFDNLVNRIKQIIDRHAGIGAALGTGTISVSACHSNCHSNCHNNRSRR